MTLTTFRRVYGPGYLRLPADDEIDQIIAQVDEEPDTLSPCGKSFGHTELGVRRYVDPVRAAREVYMIRRGYGKASAIPEQPAFRRAG